ncbi:complement C3-like [Hypomesus transpacificus]|uniref:complement C3-like n=1 Tax=Hypomesus transpacificus TaxID=137520 RepID=UPI001F088329|nr:complement C3-like [Hypomesus transpacificus]
MRVELVCVALATLAVSFPSPSDGAPLQVLSAPNVLRVGSKENVFVEIQDHSGGPFMVTVMVMNHPTKTKKLFEKAVQLNSDNKFQSFVEVFIPEEDHINMDDRQKQYVYLQAHFPSGTLEKVVLASFQAGYIFIQTDKPIYNPGTTVLYRALAVTPRMEPLTKDQFEQDKDISIDIDVVTPENITILRETVTPDKGMKSRNFKLPDIVSPGVWQLVSRFQATPQRTFTTEFEVKEYVLPSFEVKVEPRKTFFYVDDESLHVDLTARYLFGKEVNGVAYVMFGVVKGGNKHSFPSSLQRVEIQNGKGEAVLNKDDITHTFKEMKDLVSQSIYISVKVLTESGGEMVEAEKGGIQIVESPYTINFKHTPKFFKPGMPFSIKIYVTNPDQTPAGRVKLEVSPNKDSTFTSEQGIAVATVNTDISKPMKIIVKTNDPDIKSDRQATATFVVNPYESKTENLLHLSVSTKDENMQVDMAFGAGPSAMDITILILSRGQLVESIRKQRKEKQTILSFTIEVTKYMLPSFRIVAYYHVGTKEVVSDSVWVEVQTSCMGTLKVEATRPSSSYRPRDNFQLKITGDPGAKVGLVAVDKGVTVLNNKHRLTQKKIWDVVEKYDTGCTAGSGQNSMGVFYDAGLMFESNTASGTNIRTEPNCPVRTRRRRAVSEFQVRINLEAKYESLERECCVSGMKLNALEYSCVRRAKFVTEGVACQNAFKYCCEQMEAERKKHVNDELDLARSDEDDASYLSLDEITSRTNFPESWMWIDFTLPSCSSGQKCKTTSTNQVTAMPDSITTWQITAISLSKENAICVTEPFEMVVLKDFFIDLRLPYSAVYNEQLEVKAVLHNYKLSQIKVRVYLMENENICSSANKRKQYVKVVTVEAESTLVVPYVMIPMKLGEQNIEVKASVFNSELQDGVVKVLRVVPPGELITKLVTVELDPSNSGGVQKEHLKSAVPQNQVPNTPASTEINVIGGDQTSVLVETVMSGSTMGNLIQEPTGCGEQIMTTMTLPVIATRYLDTTRQWESIGLEKRATAIEYIRLGYQKEAAYCKPDGSYSIWIDSGSSSWLTAYVTKVFAMSSSLIAIDSKVVCKAVEWLIQKSQLPDGRFLEIGLVHTGGMMGGVAHLDTDASMTAFVLIALQEARPLCEKTIRGMTNNMNKAVAYLQSRLPNIKNPYSVAMVSYAMANHGTLNKELLLKFSTDLKDHWEVPEGYGTFTLEATAYALLALLRIHPGLYTHAHCIGMYMEIYGHLLSSFSKTTTIMVYQAVAEYWSKTQNVKEFNLEVDVQVASWAKQDKWIINRRNQFVTRTTKVPDVNKNLTVEARGVGTATISVLTLYYAVLDKNNPGCDDFDLEVEMVKEGKASYPGAEATYLLKIKTKYKSQERDATMSVLDIGLLTGFIVDFGDLTKLKEGKDRYIEKFEMNKALSERGSLIIYLNKVSHTEWDHVNFRIHSVDKVGVLQPAAVTVYEYYQKSRCRVFYHPQRTDGGLLRLCSGEDHSICKCAEENCSMQKKLGLEDNKRSDKACEVTKDRSVDYVFKVQMEKMVPDATTDMYTVRIVNVLKGGIDKGAMGNLREFVAFALCRESLDLQKGKTYLLMGVSKDVYKPREGANVEYQYVLGEQTWVEYWPTPAECPKQPYRLTCKGLDRLVTEQKMEGCPHK